MKYNSVKSRESRFSTALSYTLTKSEYYESIELYEPSDELRNAVILPDNWQYSIKAVWTGIVPPKDMNIVQGWKIHVSCLKTDANSILSIVSDYCFKNSLHFKFLSDYTIFQISNSKSWNRGASGKFITIYPNDFENFKIIINELSKIFGKKYVGPYILSDKRAPNCNIVFYRYGGFKLLSNSSDKTEAYIVNSDGTQYHDVRNAFYSTPPWVSEPFESKENENTQYIDNKFLITEALHFSNTGGIYLAEDLNENKEIVIKEARPYTAVDNFGNDAVYNLEKEFQILQLLELGGYTPKPISIFREWEHLFLCMEKIEGVTLLEYCAKNFLALKIKPGQNETINYYRNLIQIFINIIKAIHYIHDKEVIIGDLSHNNIFVNPETLNIKMIDFEGAKRINIDNDSNITTPGFVNQLRAENSSMQKVHDYNSLGLIFSASILPINSILEIKENFFEDAVKVTRANMFIPVKLTEIIADLMRQKNECDLDIYLKKLIDVLDDLEVEYRDYIKLKFTKFLISEDCTDVHKIINFNDSVANFQRPFRPYPVFAGEHEPLSIAFGGLGVVYAKYILYNKLSKSEESWLTSMLQSASGSHSLYTGLSGSTWALHDMGYRKEAENLFDKLITSPTLFQGLDVYSGASGSGLCALHLWKDSGNEKYLNHARRIGRVLEKLAIRNKNGISWWSDNDEIPIGYAHGASGISLFLLYLGICIDKKNYIELGFEALKHDLSYALDGYEPGIISYPESNIENSIVFPYWRWGSAGVGTTAIRYWAYTKDSELFQNIQNLVPDTQRWFSVCPGLSNGLAGLANFAIDIYQFTKDETALASAHRILASLEMYKIPKEKGLAFPGDFLFRICTDFATGSSGIALVLDRLKKSSKNFNFVCDSLLEV
jgi:serine/threonine protein kinase